MDAGFVKTLTDEKLKEILCCPPGDAGRGGKRNRAERRGG